MRTLLIAAVALVGCKAKDTPPAPRLTAPTAAQAEAFGREIARHLGPCDVAAIDQRADTNLVLTRAAAGRVTAADLEGMKRGFSTIGTVLCRGLVGDVEASYLRTQVIDGTPQPVLRLLMPDAFTYVRFELDQGPSGLRISDVYMFASGEPLSQTFVRLIDSLGGAATNDVKAYRDTVLQARARMGASEWRAAHELMQTLPPTVRAIKMHHLMELEITRELGGAEYTAALDAYRKAFPGDPSLPIILFDGAMARAAYDEALTHIDALDQSVGGDPYLDVERARVLQLQAKVPEAITAARRAAERDPTLQDAWWRLIDLQLATADHAAALVSLTTLRDTFHATVGPEQLRADPRFAALLASPEYTAWQAGTAR